MSDNTFASMMERERVRLTQEREQVLGSQQELQEKLDVINREFAAIDAYEEAKAGRQIAGPARTRTRRGSKRDDLLALIRNNPDGLSRGDILVKMGLKGDRSGEMSVSNALTALTKSNTVVRRSGKYHVNG